MSYPTTESPYPAPGEIIGDSWRVEKIMGEGGMGAVARAYNLVLHTPVAIKFMNPQFLTFPGAVERFINEGKASALIKSDHVVPVMQAGKTASGTPYLVMECLEGSDLADLLARDGFPGLPVERAVHFVLQALRALQAAHAIGIIHRDMKPSNCFVVNKDGEEDFVKILDFGISKIKQPGSASLTQTNSALGTPLYMSPEQARSPRDVDSRSDLYSVGVILYELLTGNTPFASETGEFTEILFKLFTAEPPPVQSMRADLPPALANAVHKALARDVNERFSTALEMAEAIAPFAAERSQHVLTRIRAFKPPTTTLSSTPHDLPQSMVAFSQLSHARGPSTDVMGQRPGTDVMAHRPGTEVMKSPAQTELLADAPKKLTDSGAAGGNADAPKKPTDSRAPTFFDTSTRNIESAPRLPIPGASTDLGASRDAAVAPPTARKRSPLVFALPVIALLAIGGLVIAIPRLGGKATSSASASATTASSLPGSPAGAGTTGPAAGRGGNATSNVTSNVSSTAAGSATNTASGAAAHGPDTAPTSSASASAQAATSKVTAPRPPPGHADTRPRPPGTTTSVLDTKIKE